MNTNAPQNSSIKVSPFKLTLEAAPASGTGTMPAQEKTHFAMSAHLFPVIVWPWKRKVRPAVEAHGREALNFSITGILILWPAGFISSFLGMTIARITALGTSVLSLGLLTLVVFAMLQARLDRLLRYPVNFRLIK